MTGPASAAWPARRRQLIDLLGPALALVAVYAIFAAVTAPSFASLYNLETILRQTAIVGVAALGMTMIIIAGGIDLSAGSVVAFATVVIASLLAAGVPPLLAGLAGVAAGALCGLVNGLLVTRLKIVPFIVTLGTLLVVRGVAKGLAHEQKVDAPLSWLNDLLAQLPAGRRWLLAPAGVWLMIALALAVFAILRYRRLGRHIFAVGSNETTARLCGVPVNRVKLKVYTIGAAFAGLAGLMQFSRLTVGDPTVAAGLELDIIAAVVIGGGSLAGGRGSILGSIVGALIMTVIRSGCSQMVLPGWLAAALGSETGLPNWVQEIITGSIIVLAVALDRLRHRRDN